MVISVYTQWYHTSDVFGSIWDAIEKSIKIHIIQYVDESPQFWREKLVHIKDVKIIPKGSGRVHSDRSTPLNIPISSISPQLNNPQTYTPLRRISRHL